MLEFVTFKERLDSSHAVVTTAVEARIAALQQAGQKGLATARVRTQLKHMCLVRAVNIRYMGRAARTKTTTAA